jgi:hypothetical protein
MAVQKPLVFIGGRTKQLPSGDSLAITWGWVGATPTTLAGYGITDAAASSRTIGTTAPLTGGGDLSANRTLGISAATTGAPGSMSAADKTKLDGIASGATANTGTVTSVSVANTTGLSWAGSPITTSGTLTPTLTANLQAWSGVAPSSKADVATTLAGYGITDAMATSWTLTAGNGLTGGGSGAANRTVTLGTPSDLNGATTNAVTASSHTHAINYGSVLAATTVDLSKHIALYSNTIGFCVTNTRLNYIIGSSGNHYFVVGGTDRAVINASGLSVTGALTTTGDAGIGGAASVAGDLAVTGNVSSNGTVFSGDGKVCFRFFDTFLRLNPDGAFTSGIYSGTGLLRHDGNLQVGTTSSNGFFTSPTVPPQWKGIELGYRNVPLTTTNANYTFVADDAGKCRMHTDATARVYTIPAVFAAGDVLTVVNSATGSLTLTGSGVSLYLAPGLGGAGNRTLGGRSVATVFFLNTTQALVFGVGVS